mgnify:CR=1 FL=1
MILKALYDYYNRCDNLPKSGLEAKEIGFVIVISKNGEFRYIEDCRIDSKQARTYFVKKSVGRSSGILPNYLYDNSVYVLNYDDKLVQARHYVNDKRECYENGMLSSKDKKHYEDSKKYINKAEKRNPECYASFKNKILDICRLYPNNQALLALSHFYEADNDKLLNDISKDELWNDVKNDLSKKYSVFSFRIEGDTKIIAEKKEIMQLDRENNDKSAKICLVTGKHGELVDTTTATMIPGSQTTAKLVSFQVNSGYDSYGKSKCENAPITKDAEFAYTTALNTMLGKDSRNKFRVGSRTFLFWASSQNAASEQAEESLFEMLGFSDTDDPNAKIEQARKVFKSIYSGVLKTDLDDRFYILGLAPNSARIAVVYWSETSLKDFASMILRHFDDMEIIDGRQDKKPYMGVGDMLSAVTIGGKQSEAAPNLPEAVIKSIFQGMPYPYTLFSACIRRLRAESGDKGCVRVGRMAILKAYLNRINDDNNKKIEIMLDKNNTNQGYLCGRLFAVLDRIQEKANGINSIRERYLNAASSTPAAVFATILNLSSHHLEKLSSEGEKVFYEKIKQEIIDKISADGFPAHLDLQDQGRFFVGYYHQRQDFFTKNDGVEIEK